MLKKNKWVNWLLAVFLAFPLALAGCSNGGGNGNGDSGGGEVNPAANGTVAGVVRDAATGTAMAGATVEIYSGATLVATTTTDSAGNYSVSVPAGTGYTVLIIKPGYGTNTRNNVDVSANQTKALDIDLQATPTGTIQGVVRDASTRNGIAGATIEVYDGADLIASATTDADGNYTMEVDAGDDYTVRVASAGHIPADYHDVDLEQDEIEIMEPILQIADTYTGNGTASGTITDSQNGNGLAGVTVNLRQGLNSRTGGVVATGTTDGSGAYSIASLPTGYYTAEMSLAGYITLHMPVYSLGGETTGNQNASLSPQVASGETRIVLTWGAAPADLDTHLTGPTTSGPRFHIYYVAPNVNDGTVASLDVDDINSFGPETTNITTQIAGVYRYSVYDYSNGGLNDSLALSNSGAQVKVYQASGLVASFNIPANQGGTLWTVFELNGTNITPVNTFSYVSDETTIP
jgi:hypothetical protein